MIFDWIESFAALTVAAFLNSVLIGIVLVFAVWGVIRLLSYWNPLNATTRFVVWTTVFVICTGLVFWHGGQHLALQHGYDSSYQEPVMDEPEELVHPGSPVQPVAPVKRIAPVKPLAPVQPVAPVAPLEPIRMDAPPAPEAAPESGNIPVAPENIPAVPEALSSSSEETSHDNAGILDVVVLPLVSKTRSLATSIRQQTIPNQVTFYLLTPAWSLVLFLLWGVIAGFYLIRLVTSWRMAWSLKVASYPAPEVVEASLRKVLRKIEKPRPIQVALSDGVHTAVAIGFRHPKILLPPAMVDSLSESEIEQVLLHEAAHLQRYDDWSLLVQRIVTALLFFHPGLLVLSLLMDRDREFACDDWVVSLTQRPKAYASCLAKLVMQHMKAQPPSYIPGFASSKEELFERLRSILDRKRTISFKISKYSYGGIVGVILLLLLLSMKVAPVIALPQAQQSEQIAALVPEPAPDLGSEQRIDPVLAPADLSTPEESAEPDSLVPDSLVPEPAVPDDAEYESLSRPSDTEEIPVGMTGLRVQVPGSIDALDTAEVEPMYSTDAPENLLPLPNNTSQSPVLSPKPADGTDKPLSAASLARILRSASRIPSSGDRTQVLITAASKMEFTPLVMTAYLETTASIASSGDMSKALIALVDHQELNETQTISFLMVVSKISSSGDRSRVLIASMQQAGISLDTKPVSQAYIKVIDALPSSSDYKRVMRVFLDRTN